MEAQTLQVEVRGGRGKGPARQLRMAGLIPGVIYGPGGDAVMLSLSPRDLAEVLNTEHKRNVLLKINVAGKEELAMVKELQLHPVSREVRHVDFCRAALDRKVQVDVPFGTTGRAIGVQRGGTLKTVFRTVPVLATPDKIPAQITVDVSRLEQNQAIAVKDLQLPEGVTVPMNPERRLTMVLEETKAVVEDTEVAAAGPADPAAAKAPGKPPAKKG